MILLLTLSLFLLQVSVRAATVQPLDSASDITRIQRAVSYTQTNFIDLMQCIQGNTNLEHKYRRLFFKTLKAVRYKSDETDQCFVDLFSSGMPLPNNFYFQCPKIPSYSAAMKDISEIYASFSIVSEAQLASSWTTFLPDFYKALSGPEVLIHNQLSHLIKRLCIKRCDALFQSNPSEELHLSLQHALAQSDSWFPNEKDSAKAEIQKTQVYLSILAYVVPHYSSFVPHQWKHIGQNTYSNLIITPQHSSANYDNAHHITLQPIEPNLKTESALVSTLTYLVTLGITGSNLQIFLLQHYQVLSFKIGFTPHSYSYQDFIKHLYIWHISRLVVLKG